MEEFFSTQWTLLFQEKECQTKQPIHIGTPQVILIYVLLAKVFQIQHPIEYQNIVSLMIML